MKIKDNHYTYRIETKDSNGGSLDFIDIDTVEPLRCAYDVQDELNLETNEHIKRVEEVVLDANSTEFWYVDEVRTSDTHLVCYFEEVELMASKDHPMVDTDRSVFEYGKINSNEHQDTNFICTHVMDNGVSRIYMSIDKETFGFATYNNETIKHFISNNPVTVWYALRYEVIIPRSMSKGHLLTLGGQTDITLTTTSEQAKLPIMKFNIGDTQYTLDTNPIHINNTQEGTQIRNIVLEGNTPINYARGNGVNTTEQVSNTRYDFEPFYDGQTTIQGTVEGGYVSAKLYGDTMVNIAKSYGETPLLTATNESVLCDDLLGMNEEGIVLADGEITEGRIYGDTIINGISQPLYNLGNIYESDGLIDTNNTNNVYTDFLEVPDKNFIYHTGYTYTKIAYYDSNKNFISCQCTESTEDITSNIPSNASYIRLGTFINGKGIDGFTYQYIDGSGDVIFNKKLQSVVNPTVYNVNENLFDLDYVFNQANYKDYGALYPSVKIQLKPNTAYYFERNDEGFMNEFKGTYMVITNYETPKDNGAWIAHAAIGDGMCFKNVKITTGNSGIIYFSIAGVLAKDGQQHLDSLRELHFSNAFLIENSSTNKVYTPHHHTQATFPYTLNKLPNGVADYIDVVNKVHVQRVGVFVAEGSDDEIWEVHTPSTIEEVSCVFSVPLDFKCNGNHNSSSSGVTICDKWEFGEVHQINVNNAKEECVQIYNSTLRLKLHKDRLPSVNVNGLKTYLQTNQFTVLCELATPIYTPLTEEEIAQLPLSAYKDGYVNLSSDQLIPSFEFRIRASNRYQVDMLETGYYYLNAPVGNVKLGTASVDVQQMPCIVKVDNVGTGDSGYRLGFDGEITDTTQITLAKLPSHRIPTSFTQGMKCGTDFGYWEGVKESAWRGIRLTGETGDGSLRSVDNLIRYLNRIEGNYQGQVIVEDEFDFATGKLTKRIGKVVVHNLTNVYDIKSIGKECTYMSLSLDKLGIKCKNSFSNGAYGFAMSSVVPFKVDYNGEYAHMFTTAGYIKIIMKNSELGTLTQEGIVKYFEANPMTVYYELAVPEISYIDVLSHEGKTVNNETKLGTSYYLGTTYLNPQIKPSHLTYPVPSLVGNRTYTVVHNRKNITGSTKPIELNLGGTVVQLNDASSKTLVKTPSTLAHSNLIFIGGESTVDHIMVLDGDWTNKPIEYFENMMGHDTDAIITIIGNGQIDDVEEQYLW